MERREFLGQDRRLCPRGFWLFPLLAEAENFPEVFFLSPGNPFCRRPLLSVFSRKFPGSLFHIGRPRTGWRNLLSGRRVKPDSRLSLASPDHRPRRGDILAGIPARSADEENRPIPRVSPRHGGLRRGSCFFRKPRPDSGRPCSRGLLGGSVSVEKGPLGPDHLPLPLERVHLRRFPHPFRISPQSAQRAAKGRGKKG